MPDASQPRRAEPRPPAAAEDVVYQALLAQDGGAPHLAALALALQADGVALLRLAGDAPDSSASWGIARAALERMRRRARTLAARPAGARQARAGDVRTARLGAHLVLQLCWRGDDGAMNVAALLRRGLAAQFTADDRAALVRLRPHVARAMALARELAEARENARRRGDALDALAQPVVIADRRGAVLFANRAAHALPRHAGLRVMRGQRLAAPRPGDAAALRRALGATTEAIIRHVAVAARIGDGGLTAQFFALDAAGLRRPGQETARLALMVLRQARRARRASVGQLGERYRLTPAERHVLALVLDGHRAAAVAQRLGVALATVRTQLRSIYEKTGCRGRAALVALSSAGGRGPG